MKIDNENSIFDSIRVTKRGFVNLIESKMEYVLCKYYRIKNRIYLIHFHFQFLHFQIYSILSNPLNDLTMITTGNNCSTVALI